MPKLTAQSPARKILAEKFLSGEISGDEDPKAVSESDAIFMAHKLSNFRTHYNKMRKNPPTRGSNEEDLTILERRSTELDVKKRRLSAVDLESEEEDTEFVYHDGPGAELLFGDLEFKPLYLMASWVEPTTTTKRITISIALPSGVGIGDFSLAVPDGSQVLELTVKWPSPVVNLEILHPKWLQKNTKDGYTIYYPKILAFETALKEKRERAVDQVTSAARLPLPFPVQAHIDSKSNLHFRETGTKIVYVDLKAMVETYAVANDTKELEDV